jgi:hypothetical protein
MPGVRLVCLADSEGDIDALFAESRGEPAIDWVIRACQDRATCPSESDSDSAGHLRERLLAMPVWEEIELPIRSRHARIPMEDRARRQDREGRRARLQVRAKAVTLRPPWRPERELPPVAVNVVSVCETSPPAGEGPVEWRLLTTLPIDTLEQVRGVIERYPVRWNLEVFFRTLQSGGRIEHRRFEEVSRLLPCLALCLIVTWRTLFVCRLGRECPEFNGEVVFEPPEWQAVWSAVYRKELPAEPPPLGEVVRLIARLGGYVERPHHPPGAQTIWIGLQRMNDLAWAWESFGPPTRNRGGGLV